MKLVIILHHRGKVARRSLGVPQDATAVTPTEVGVCVRGLLPDRTVDHGFRDKVLEGLEL